jgi:hypothetical protein
MGSPLGSILMMHADGTDLLSLGSGEVGHSGLVAGWTRVVYSGIFTGRTFIVNLDGTGRTEFCPDTSVPDPVWSPDGVWLIYTDGGICIVREDCTGFMRLTTMTVPAATCIRTGSSQASGRWENHSPVLSPIGDTTVTIYQPLTFTVTATDADGDALTFRIPDHYNPGGASFNPETGVFSWTPTIEGDLKSPSS